MGVIYYDIATLLLLVVNIYLFKSRSRLFVIRTRVFSVLLYITFISAAMDLLSVLAYWNASRIDRAVHYAISVVFYAAHNSIPLTFFVFLFSLGGQPSRLSRVRWAAVALPWACSLSLILTTPLTGLIFSFSESLEYARGAALPFLYLSALSYTALGVVWLIVQRRRIPAETRFAVFLFLPFSLIPVAIQFFIPQLLVQSLGIAISELFILLTIQDFGRYVDTVTALFNQSGFRAQFSTLAIGTKPFTVYLIVLEATDFLRNALGVSSFTALERALVKGLFGSPREGRFGVRFDSGSFALVVTGTDAAAVERARIQYFFASPIKVESVNMSLSPRVCEIRVPADTKDVRRIFQALHELGKRRVGPTRHATHTLKDLSIADSGRQRDVANAIRTALVAGGFSLHYQPIVSTATGRVVSAEALIRMDPTIFGAMSPGEFITIAEQNGTIHRIGDFVLEEACRFFAETKARGIRFGKLSINLSQSQCIQVNLAERIYTVATRHGLSPEDLTFEITETAAGLSPGIMKKNMEALASAGFSVAIDDFGTGYSNIANLMELPFSVVKLDRSIVEGVSKSAERRKALAALVTMIKPIGATTIAEGVETEDDRAVVADLGIDDIQGYLYSRALPESEFVDWVLAGETACT